MIEEFPIATIEKTCDVEEWSLSVIYYYERDVDNGRPVADIVKNGSLYYKCIQDHITVSGTTEPGVSSSWETYWREMDHYTYDLDKRYYEDPDNPGKFYKGYCWKLCPYSEQWYDKYENDGYYRRVQQTGTTRTFTGVRVPASDQTDHTLTLGTMRFHQRGSKTGFLCDDPACRYKITNGVKFFEV